MATPKKITQLAGSRSKLIGDLLNRLENQVKASQRDLLETVLNDFLDGMETDEAGNIKNTLANKRRFSMFDQVFSRFAKDKGLEVVKGLSEGVGRVVDFNKQYYSAFEKPAILAPIHANVKETVNSWLGLSDRGSVQPNGYLDTLIKDPSVKNKIRDIALRGVISQAGYNETKTNLKNHIIGSGDNTGALERYYRNFAYDLYSVADRTSAKVYADKLKFNYAIYEGGLIETSREFCEEHNGKVYSREEIADFDPKVAKPPGYDPFTDLGGYGCRHHLNWVPDAVAFSMRPDLKDKQAPKAVEEPPKKETPKAEEITPGKLPKFKTVEEAKEPAAELLRKLSPGLNIETVKTHADLTPEAFNLYIQHLSTLTNDYNVSPVYAHNAKPRLSFSSTDKALGFVQTSGFGGSILEINFGHRADITGSRRYIKDSGELRYKSRVDEENLEVATVVHEFAHVISTDRQANPYGGQFPEIKEFWDKMATLKRKYVRELSKLGKYEHGDTMETLIEKRKAINEIHLGDYASTNLNEFMAEAFTEYRLSSNPSKYATEAGKLIDKYFKKKK